MQAQFILSLLATTVFPALALAQADTAAVPNTCGSLGEFHPASLPAGVDPTQLRHCAEHPLGPAADIQKREAEAAGAAFPELDKRACWWGKSAGCTDGYCWKSCGSRGEWCWTAINSGYGDWQTCSSDSNCKTSMACGRGDCKKCGCSC